MRGAMEPERFATISVLSRTLDAANSPIQRFEHMAHPWVAFGIVPAFALFNAGVAIDASAIRTLAFPVPLGIMAGLVIGKPAALFISGLAFPGTGLESQAKLGILLASLVSAVVGIAILATSPRATGVLSE